MHGNGSPIAFVNRFVNVFVTPPFCRGSVPFSPHVGTEMLVLSRKAQQQIRAGKFLFTILEIVGNRVKVGVVGPADEPIHREEVHQRMLAQAAESTVNHDRH